MKYLVTHGGTAHLDDFFCACVFLRQELLHTKGSLTSKPQLVNRREPTKEELDDPEVLVVDAGRQYDPHKNNFDYHQGGDGGVVFEECALSLYAKTIPLEDTWETCGTEVSLDTGLSSSLAPSWYMHLKKPCPDENRQWGNSAAHHPYSIHIAFELALLEIFEYKSPLSREVLMVLATIGERITHIAKLAWQAKQAR